MFKDPSLTPPPINPDTAISAIKEINKAAAVIIHSLVSEESWQNAIDSQQRCYQAGLPVHSSIARGVSAIDKLIRYYENGRSPKYPRA